MFKMAFPKLGIINTVLLISLFSLSMQLVVAQDGYWVPRDPPKSNYTIEVKIDVESSTVEGKEKVKISNCSNKPIAVIALDWSISDASSIKTAAAGSDLVSMNEINGASTQSPLLYRLPEPLFPGSETELQISFSAKDLFDGKENKIKLIKWYPRLWWEGLSMHDRFEVKIESPEGYALAASGRLDPETGYYVNNSVATFGIYLGKGMLSESRDAEGISVTSIHTEEGAECAKLCLETAVDAVKFYKEYFGFYPFEFLSMVPGQENPNGGYPLASGIVAIHGQEKFEERPVVFWQWITAHEVGHQYWGEYVMDPDSPDWLRIGLGIYSDREYLKSRNFGAFVYSGLMGEYLKGVQEFYDTSIDIPPSYLSLIQYDFNSVVIHGKGFAVVGALEVVLGSDTFKRLLNRCLREFGGKRIGYRDFWRLAEEESGENLSWFFEQWVRSNKYLCYVVESTESARGENGKYLSKAVVKRAGALRMPVPVKALFADGSEQVKITEANLDTTLLTFESNAELDKVILDPEKKLAMLEEPLAMAPDELVEIIQGMDLSGAGEKALEYFDFAKKFRMEDSWSWFVLAMNLFEGGHYEQAFEAFDRVRDLDPPEVATFAALAGMGMIKDLQGEREDAVEYYTKALSFNATRFFTIEPYDVEINRQWVEERLKTPFTLEKE